MSLSRGRKVARKPSFKRVHPVDNRKKTKSYKIDCTAAAEDKIINPDDLVVYLKNRLKIDGKCGNIANLVSIICKNSVVSVETLKRLHKRALKYYVKKFLKKNQVRDYLRVISSDKSTYSLQYFEMEGAA